MSWLLYFLSLVNQGSFSPWTYSEPDSRICLSIINCSTAAVSLPQGSIVECPWILMIKGNSLKSWRMADAVGFLPFQNRQAVVQPFILFRYRDQFQRPHISLMVFVYSLSFVTSLAITGLFFFNVFKQKQQQKSMSLVSLKKWEWIWTEAELPHRWNY